LEARSPEVAHAFRADLGLASTTCRNAVGAQRANSQDNTWAIWVDFCSTHDVDPLLETCPDPIPYLQVFAQRYRDGRLAKDGKPVRARTVEDALRAVGQTMASFGATDKRLIAPRQMVAYRLKTQLAGYARGDPEPSRVQPASLALVAHGFLHATSALDIATADMAYIAFFFLCRPGEYAATTSVDAQSLPFRLCDVSFTIGARTFSACEGALPDIPIATFVMLTYSNQKNGVRGERVGHGRSGHPASCPVAAIARRVLHLRHASAPPTTPLFTVFSSPTTPPLAVTSSRITSMLRLAATSLQPTLGLDPRTISARSLRAGGAMALLCARVDTDIIRLVGRWRSDEMLRYLHLQAYPLMHTFARQMHSQGSFTLLPGQVVAPAAVPLLDQVPP
jgi:hypothetical protein